MNGKMKSRRLSDVVPDGKDRSEALRAERAAVRLAAAENADGGESEDDVRFDENGEAYIPRRRRRAAPADGVTFDENGEAVFPRERYNADSVTVPVKGRKTVRPSDDRDEKTRCLDSAVKILSYGANTRKRLTEKLTQRGYGAETVTAVCDELEARGILNDRRELDGAVMALAKKYGPARIPQELKALGFDEELVASVDYDALPVDFTAACRAYLEAHGDDAKSAAALYRRGYTGGILREARKAMEDE